MLDNVEKKLEVYAQEARELAEKAKKRARTAFVQREEAFKQPDFRSEQACEGLSDFEKERESVFEVMTNFISDHPALSVFLTMLVGVIFGRMILRK